MSRARDFKLGPPAQRPRLRVLNPHKIDHVFIFAADERIRDAGRELERQLPFGEVTLLADPARLTSAILEQAFVLFVDEGALPFVDRAEFKRANRFGTIILLSSNLRVGAAPTQAEIEEVCPLANRADLVFYVNGGDCSPLKVMPSFVRFVEDSHNIEYHKRAKRFIFLVVDDELRWFSQFLPLLYRIIGRRADVMLARTYEEAERLMEQHGSDVVCLITDLMFPKGGVVSAAAGHELVVQTKRRHPRIPIIIASQEERSRSLAHLALVLPKGDPGAIETLDQYVHDFTGMGDFLFYDGHVLWRRASTLAELRDAVAAAPIAMLEEYAGKDYFSTWLYMHGFRRIADFLRARRDHGDELRQVLLDVLDEQLQVLPEQELILVDKENQPLARARDVEDLLALFQKTDAETLTVYGADEAFSMWAMVKGYPQLADELRQIVGKGEALRKQVIATLRRWQARRR